MNNSIYLRRKKKVFLEKGDNTLPGTYITTLLYNIKSLGFTLSPELCEVVLTLSMERLDKFYKQLVTDLKVMVGDHVQHRPMYPNFPEQVMHMSQVELFVNAQIHYLGDWLGRRILPQYEKKERPGLADKTILVTIDLGTKDDFKSIFTKLLNAKTSISETDKEDVLWFIKNHGDNIDRLFPAEIPLKENVALVAGALIEHTTIAGPFLAKYVKTATDVLRIATAMSDGDISLAENTIFKSFSKKNRRLLLHLLESCNSITEDMLRHKNRWKRLGERLHPFEYKKRYPKCYDAFAVIRNELPFETFNRKLEQHLLQQDIKPLTALLRTRPGEFARKLDKMLRLTANRETVLKVFRDISSRVSSPVLLQVHAHFKHRNEKNELRVFFPKGNVSSAFARKNELPELPDDICREVMLIAENTLINKFKTYPPLGATYLDKLLKNYTVPFALRSASKALKTIPRGSRIDLPAGNTIRFFIYWKDGKSRTDIDLSAVGLDHNSLFKTVIAYYQLRDWGGHHSGDITSAPNGASEFIDITIPNFLSAGIRYLLMSVNSFTLQPYCDLPICFAGFMMRQSPNSGEIYEPLTVENKFHLTANTRIAIPLIIDLAERKVIWTDLSLTRNPSHRNNVHQNLAGVTIMNKAMTSLAKPGLYDLLQLHVRARGTQTDEIQSANTIFAVNKGITPFDTDRIISEFL